VVAAAHDVEPGPLSLDGLIEQLTRPEAFMAQRHAVRDVGRLPLPGPHDRFDRFHDVHGAAATPPHPP
jgi:hypothetical protein